jgi:hypothetical protein
VPESTFDYLSGVVRVPAAAPPNWELDGLDAFYENPNHSEWGDTLCRVLYHESVHFWQFLASSYLANLVGKEWARLRAFEETGEVRLEDEAVRAFGEGEPFSAFELAEAWARFWDVHTRSPARIIAEDPELAGAVPEPARQEPRRGYVDRDFDLVMQSGSDCMLYAAPYRWALDRAGGDSYLTALVFPIACHAAFASRNPIDVFVGTFTTAIAVGEVRDAMLSRRISNINLAWAIAWTMLMLHAVEPALRELELSGIESGIDAIARGDVLADHPVFGEYPERAQILHLRLGVESRWGMAKSPLQDETLLTALRKMATMDPRIVFGLPGEPMYRSYLGKAVPPPRVEFMNFACLAPMMLEDLPLLGGAPGETRQQRTATLRDRVQRFRNAERAVSLGLPAGVFESPV